MKLCHCSKIINYFLQIVVGGRNKYLINGVNAQNQRVHDLFQSVSLNVNNPHFLIMQVSLWFDEFIFWFTVLVILALCMFSLYSKSVSLP